MAKALRHRHDILSVADKDRCHAMTEHMRVDMGKIMVRGKLAQPCGDAVWDHRLPVVLHKEKISIVPAIPIFQTQFQVPAAILAKKIHCLSRELDKANRTCFGGVLINPPLWGVEQVGINFDLSVLKVYPAPA